MSSQDFQIISRLGDGAFSSVYKVRRISDGQEYAMKKVKIAPLSEKEKHNALNEVRILASINNPYIIGYKEAFFEDNPLTLCIVMEYAGGGDIFSLITQHKKYQTSFKEQDIWRFSANMLMGLKALHGMKILHRDLKCANVFLSTDSKIAKLGDLNVSKVAKNELAYTQTGTPYYASPEVWRDQPYDAKSDIWSLGCVIYEMCALRPPFQGVDMPSLNNKIQKGVFDRIPFNYSNDLQTFITQCLQVKPSQRSSTDELLRHPIIRRNVGLDVLDILGVPSPNNLLDTIKFPRNLKALVLPKANYSQDSQALETKRDRYSRGLPKESPKENVPVKRPTSQYAPISKNRVMIRETYSRERNSSNVPRYESNISKESDQEYIARMQKEYIDKARIYKPVEPTKYSSPKGDLMDQISYNPRVSPLKKHVDIIERPRSRVGDVSRNIRGETPKISDMKEKAYRGINEYSRPQAEPVISQVRPRLYSREKKPEIDDENNLTQRQKLLINKYQKNNTMDEKMETPFVYSEKAHLLLKKADSLIEKYQGGGGISNREGVSSRQEIRRPVVSPINNQRERKYFSNDQNQVNLYQRPESKGIANRENDKNYLNRNILNIERKNSGNLRIKPEGLRIDPENDWTVKNQQIRRKLISRQY